MDDYSHCFMAYLNAVPALTLSLPSLSIAITHILSSLSCPAPEIIRISLDVLAKLSDASPSQPPLQAIFSQYGKGIITLVLQGLIQDFPEDCMDEIEKILVGTMGVVGSQGEAWAGEALGSVPGHLVPVADRSAFLAELHE
jgi:transportin-3